MSEINIFISGDFCPILDAEEKLLDGFNSQEIFSDLDENIQKDDISVTNFECLFTLVYDMINKLGDDFKSNSTIPKILKNRNSI